MQWEQLHQTSLYVRQTLSETSILPAPFVPPERRRRAAGSSLRSEICSEI